MNLQGLILQNRYHLNTQIGRGGMSEVWAAKDKVLGRIVAIKIASLKHKPSWDSFQHEAEISASLDHPHIVSIFDIGRVKADENTALKDAPYIIMENIPGMSLKEKIRSGMEYKTISKYWLQTLEAVEYAHANQIIHRDLKPSNILIDASDNIKIADFGVAKAEQKDWTDNKIVGTAAYIAPEIIQGQEASKQSDVYSLGVVFYQCLTGRLPFENNLKSNRTKITPASKLNPYIKEDPLIADWSVLDAFILRALGSKNQRYASAKEMKAAFLAFGGIPKTTSRKRLVFLVLIGLICIALGVFFLQESKTASRDEVPNLVGMNIDSAKAAAEKLGFEIETGQRISNRPKQEVILQDPAPGENIDNLQSIYLLVSIGRGKKPIPRTHGMLEAEARQVLKKSGWVIIKTVQEYNNNVSVGRIINSNPKPGEKLDLDAPIELIVSSGKIPREVPDLLNMQINLARDILEKSSLRFKEQYTYSNKPAGIVLLQAPNPGRKINPLKTIVLTVSRGAEPEIAPMLVGESIENARAILAELKISYSAFELETTDSSSNSIVLEQSPLAGEILESNQVIQLKVGKYVSPDFQETGNNNGGLTP